jgi:hypothetical protein
MKINKKIELNYKYVNDDQANSKLYLAYELLFDEIENKLNVKTYENNRGLSKT